MAFCVGARTKSANVYGPLVVFPLYPVIGNGVGDQVKVYWFSASRPRSGPLSLPLSYLFPTRPPPSHFLPRTTNHLAFRRDNRALGDSPTPYFGRLPVSKITKTRFILPSHRRRSVDVIRQTDVQCSVIDLR